MSFDLPDVIWEQMVGEKPVREFRFHPVRKWRFDFCWPDKKTAVEIEGGIFLPKSRHTSCMGYSGDMEKYNAAAELGWTVLRYIPNHLDYEQIKRCLNRSVS